MHNIILHTYIVYIVLQSLFHYSCFCSLFEVNDAARQQPRQKPDDASLIIVETEPDWDQSTNYSTAQKVSEFWQYYSEHPPNQEQPNLYGHICAQILCAWPIGCLKFAIKLMVPDCMDRWHLYLILNVIKVNAKCCKFYESLELKQEGQYVFFSETEQTASEIPWWSYWSILNRNRPRVYPRVVVSCTFYQLEIIKAVKCTHYAQCLDSLSFTS